MSKSQSIRFWLDAQKASRAVGLFPSDRFFSFIKINHWPPVDRRLEAFSALTLRLQTEGSSKVKTFPTAQHKRWWKRKRVAHPQITTELLDKWEVKPNETGLMLWKKKEKFLTSYPPKRGKRYATSLAEKTGARQALVSGQHQQLIGGCCHYRNQHRQQRETKQ